MVREKRGARQTKAQISIFMILATLLLLGGVLWFTVLDVSEQEVEFIPEDIKPVHEYITRCLYDSTEEAMQRIGQTGGYVNIPQQISANPSAYLEYSPFVRNPYWWHDGTEAIPSLEFIQQEAQKEAERRISECLDNLSAFGALYNPEIFSGPTVSILFGDEDTRAMLDYPVALRTPNNGTRHDLGRFSTTLPIRFKKMHNLSALLIERAGKDEFIERTALDLMAMVPKDIPMMEMEISCDTKRWNEGDVRKRLQRLLQVNLPYIKIRGTPFSTTQYVSIPPVFQQGKGETFENSYFNYHYIWDLGVEDFGGLRVGMEYDPRWPMGFAVRPSNKGEMESNALQGTELLSMFCMQVIHFTYDVRFPVRVSVVDDSSAKPYVFSFAFTNTIDHNQPAHETTGYTLFDAVDTVSTSEYCSQREHPVTIYTVNNVTGDPVRGVNLTFVCGRFRCPVGHTNWLSFGAAAGLTKEFPRCTKGIIRGSKQGFMTGEKFITVDRNDKAEFLFLTPVKEISFRAVKHSAATPSQDELLTQSERVALSISAKDTDFQSSTYYTTDNSDIKLPLYLLNDATHTYQVSARLIKGEEVIGGYDGEWTVDGTQLGNARTVLFHVIESANADPAERALFLQNLAAHSKNIPQPEIA